MEEILNFISQNYVYIPASVIGALLVIIPAVVKIARIVTSNTVQTVKLANTRKAHADMRTEFEKVIDAEIEDAKEEKQYLLALNNVAYNKREKDLNTLRIAKLDAKVERLEKSKKTIGEQKEALAEEKKATKKVKVKVIKSVAKEVAQTVKELN